MVYFAAFTFGIACAALAYTVYDIAKQVLAAYYEQKDNE